MCFWALKLVSIQDFKKRHLRGVLGFPGGSENKETTCSAGPRFNPWVGRSPGEGNVDSLQCSYLQSSGTEEPGRV